MRLRRNLSLIFLTSALTLPASAQQKSAPTSAPSTKTTQSAPTSALPADFAGFHKSPQKTSAAAPADTKILQEYGLKSSETANYQRSDRNLKITAYTFPDATGAYGAFTYFRTPSMAKEDFCDDAASDGNHVLFRCTNVLLDINLDQVTAMTPAEMRELASDIPRAAGNLAKLPTLPLHLSSAAQKNARYIVGPLALDQLKGTVNSKLIDFSMSPEVVVGTEQTLDGTGTVVIAQYPTNQIAKLQVQKLNDWAKQQNAQWTNAQALTQQPASASDTQPTRFATRRSGPIVAIVSGPIAEIDARKILEEINYDASVTWNEPAPNAKNNVANLLVNIIYLSFFVVAFMFILGIAFGGFRIFMKRFFPGKLIDRPEDVEFIKLNLR
jgi:uncharacterized protein DUF6599